LEAKSEVTSITPTQRPADVDEPLQLTGGTQSWKRFRKIKAKGKKKSGKNLNEVRLSSSRQKISCANVFAKKKFEVGRVNGRDGTTNHRTTVRKSSLKKQGEKGKKRGAS